MRGVPIVLIITGLCVSTAAAEPPESSHSLHHGHPPEHAQLHRDFYSTLERPNAPPGSHKSCCSNRDCQPVRARNSGGQWEFWGHAGWRRVPPDVMLSVRSPDNQAHACVSQITDQILCFVKPEAGI
jgi:hypothetical protein